MSDTAAPGTPHLPRNNGRFVKGGPGGPGRPRGSVNRGDPAMARAVVLTLLKLGGLERRVALLEGELKRRKRAAGSRRRFVDGFRRLFGGRHVRKSQPSKASAQSEGFPTVYKP
jgi:hypothetical protein